LGVSTTLTLQIRVSYPCTVEEEPQHSPNFRVRVVDTPQ
jgi:hypothetical protein